MTDARPMLVQSNSPLVITCGGCGCGGDVRPQFTPDGLRQLPAYCECTFLNVDPRIVDDAESADGAVSANAEVEAA